MQRYRADIDGLRAVAVVPVVLFHAGVPGFSGGYAGVDVFFVISGYLITQLILRDERAGFSIVAFYERRVRRILPALYGVFLFTLLAALVLLPPYDLVNFSQSLSASSIFLSNIWFWKQEGYFTLGAQSQPLLHIWSLGVEEQFYLVFPIATMGVMRFAPGLFRPLLGAVCVGSLIASQLLINHIDHPSFYLPQFRAWELAVGALLAGEPVSVALPSYVREGGAAIGLAAIACTFVFFRSDTPFPGVNALLPVLGTAIYIDTNAARTTRAGRALSITYIRSIGLISYSLYLWHWPILVFLHFSLAGIPSSLDVSLAVGASVLAAVLSWRFLETPFRKKDGIFRRTMLFVAAGIGAVLFLTAGLFIRASGGLPQRMPESVRHIAGYAAYARTPQFAETFSANTCFQWRREDLDRRAMLRCLTPSTTQPNVLLWGDSHAGHYSAGLHALAAAGRFQLMQATGAGCRPLLGTSTKLSKLCNEMNRMALDAIKERHPSAIILSLFWLRNSPTELPSVIADIEPTIERLRRLRIPTIVVGPGLVLQESLPAILARRLLHGEGAAFDPASFLVDGWQSTDNALRARFGHVPGVTYVSVREAICIHNVCPVMATPRVPLLWDNSHLTLEGSVIVARRLFGDDLSRAAHLSIRTR